LAELQGKKWIRSEERLFLLKKWAGGKTSEYDANKIISRLDIAHQHGKLDNAILVKLLTVILNNKGMPVSERRNALFLAGRIYKVSKQKEDIFSFLITQVKNAKEENLRYGAAYALRNFVSLDGKQAAIVQTLKKNSKDKKLVEILQEALDRSEREEKKEKSKESKQSLENSKGISPVLIAAGGVVVLLLGFALLRARKRAKR